MDPKKAIIAGSIALVLIGLGVTGVLVYRARVTPTAPETTDVNGTVSPTPTPAPTTGAATTTPTSSASAQPVDLRPPAPTPDYTNAPDSDHDGLPDALELANGTDPHKADTDGDGYSDYEEFERGTNPLDPTSHPAQHDQKKP